MDWKETWQGGVPPLHGFSPFVNDQGRGRTCLSRATEHHLSRSSRTSQPPADLSRSRNLRDVLAHFVKKAAEVDMRVHHQSKHVGTFLDVQAFMNDGGHNRAILWVRLEGLNTRSMASREDSNGGFEGNHFIVVRRQNENQFLILDSDGGTLTSMDDEPCPCNLTKGMVVHVFELKDTPSTSGSTAPIEVTD
jgi:hypothetical protein